MTKAGLSLIAFATLAFAASEAGAAQCGNSAGGYENWKSQFASEARANGISERGVSALMQSSYNTATIRADRGQKSFKLSLEQFLAKRGGSVIVSKGRQLKQTHAALFASLQQRYGVPPGPLLAIWGMETGFGAIRGNQNVISAVATLAYDCRRSAFFTDQLYAALKLVDRGVFSAGTRGSMHGEVGQTQFMPKAVLNYAGGSNVESGPGALTATANFLRGHGWSAGSGYQPGQANFGVLQEWNAASVYQRAIAHIGRQIDGGE